MAGAGGMAVGSREFFQGCGTKKSALWEWVMTTLSTVPAPGKLCGCPLCGTRVTLWGLSDVKWDVEVDCGLSLSPLAGIAHKSSAPTKDMRGIFGSHWQGYRGMCFRDLCAIALFKTSCRFY